MEQEVEYDIAKEKCISLIKGVCNSCGGELVPIETVNNAREKTFWAGCTSCNIYHWGTPKKVFEIAKDLVYNKGHVAYSHMKKSEDLEYWYKSQIAGTCRLVMDVLSSAEKIEANFLIN